MADDFLSRWSRLKRRTEKAERPHAVEPQVCLLPPAETNPDAIARRGGAPEETEPASAAAPDAPASLTEEEIADLPSLDALSAASDIRPFLRAGVPSALRNGALRRMWSLDPGIRDFVSEAREYAYDWNSPGSVPGLGPLLASDDVKAMVRRIFEGPVVEPALDADAERADAEAPASTPLQANERSCAVISTAEAAGAAVGTCDSPTQPLEASGAGTVRAAGRVASAPLPAPRMRRHGGALPS